VNRSNFFLALCALAAGIGAHAADVGSPQVPPASPDAPEIKGAIWRGDLDEMKRRRVVRMLVAQSKTFYFVDKAREHGVTYEAGVELEEALNRGSRNSSRPMRVVFIPTRRDRLLAALNEGRGDIAAGNLTITSDRLRIVDFSAPVATGVREILVTRRGASAPSSAEGLSGSTVNVRKSSSYFSSLAALNSRLSGQGKAPVRIGTVDENLEDEDLLEMVNAGLIPATIVDSHIAEFWQQIFREIELHPAVVLRQEGEIAWAFRKDSPQLKAVVDAFIAAHRIGTGSGNAILHRYFQNTKWARQATAPSDLQRFTTLSKYFQKYGAQYGFEWLLLVAQGYQESGLEQSVRSPVGAVGVMQVLPETARLVRVSNIELVEPNIHAGVKYLRMLVNQYFAEPGIDANNRMLFAFAAYNAGPNRIARLREQAATQGLDPDKWFDNVELAVARDVGRETVRYVSNIFQYYVAYKLEVERTQAREAAKQKMAPVATREPPAPAG
jgi:membrane-bound lytic murein transglycosylase MltF